MPTLEIARRLVGGRWKTVQVDESQAGGDPGGGSQPIRIVHKTINFDDAGLTSGVLVATIAENEVVLRSPCSTMFFPTIWDGTNPNGQFLADNGIEDPYDFLAGIALNAPDAHADGRAISNTPGVPDLYSEETNGGVDFPMARQFQTNWEARGGDVDLLYRISADNDGVTDPEATQGQLKIVLMIVTAPA